ncbi:hypothetical protein [Thiofilum flexile]|uniref:hypothetical protein n=1 Tax=Thiofilum flexile TaxID=125627 RepID=UPI00037DFE96|nr:hypothetical protein [Thiofilum flexile]
MIRPARVAPEATAHHYYQQAVILYKQRYYPEALKQLALGLQVDADYKLLYLLARDIFAKLNGAEERRLFAIALSDFNQFQAFFDLGYHFIDTEHYELAAALLEKALKLAPTNIDAAYELAFAYMARFKNQEALAALSKVDYESDFWAAYLYYQCKLWLKQPEGIIEFIDDVQLLLDNKKLNESADLIQDKVTELQESLKRYQQVSFNDQVPIREWHFVQYGCAILAYNEENTAIAGGRYTHLVGDLSFVHLILDNLTRYLASTQRIPKKIVALPDPESMLLGLVLAELLQLPCNLLEIMEDFTDCLVVAADSQSFNGIEPLIDILPNQTVFALHHTWLSRSMIIPDVVGVISQFYTSPWSELGLTDDSEMLTGLTKRILAASIERKTSFDRHLTFYQQHAEWLKGGKLGGNKRSPYSIESPIGGEYYF